MNPFGPSTTGELAAYRSGQWDAESSVRGEINGLVSQTNALQNHVQRLQADLSVVIPNRDDLAKQAWTLHYELEDSKKGIQILMDAFEEAVQDLEEQRKRHAQTLEDRQEFIDYQLRRMTDYGSFADASIAAARCLIEAAEAGKLSRQDYIEFKALYQQMCDLWDLCKDDARKDPEFVAKANALMESLSE